MTDHTTTSAEDSDRAPPPLARPRGGWLGVCLRAILVLVCWSPIPAALVAFGGLLHLAQEVPEVPDLRALEVEWPSRIERLDGGRIAGAEATAEVPFGDLPPQLITAFLAAEDEDFFTHDAFNARAILRAALANWRAGTTVQGGSTITQQLAKRFMGDERSYQRKVRELLLARRLEATHSKTELLATYLRTVFMGHTVYGVTQASWFYFGRDPRDLSVGQAATLAGMLPAPNLYDPLRHPEEARRVRDRVLRRMRAIGALSDADLDAALRAPLDLHHTPESDAASLPWARTTAVKFLHDSVGEQAWGSGGYRLVMPHNPVAQADAQLAIQRAVLEYEKRQGWRGPLARAATPDDLDPLIDALARRDDPRGRLRLGVVTRAWDEGIEVARGEHRIEIPLGRLRWAEPSSTPRHYKNPVTLRVARRAFARGDLLALTPADGAADNGAASNAWDVVPRPSMNGALYAMNSKTGRLVASIGGVDPADAFHRAEQGCRQPGSVFKPIVYGEALSARISAASMLSDTPREVTSSRGKVWKPRNADRNFRGYMTMARAIMGSRNIPTINLAEYVGIERIAARAKRLGISTPLDPVPSLALGSSCVHPREMVGVYAAISRRGHTVESPTIETLIDARGDVVRDEGSFTAPHLPVAMRLDRIATPPRERTRGFSAEVAYILGWMLRRVVRSGTAHELPDAWLVAGKTGTTNTFDTWFVGMDDHLSAGVWIGSDLNTREIGAGEHGATVAMPAFADFMAPRVTARTEEIEEAERAGEIAWPADAPERIRLISIDEPTGLRAREGEPGRIYPFIRGTAPDAYAPTKATRQAERIDELSLEF